MQLQQCFVKLQRQPDFEQLQDLLARYDKDGNERIDFEEFCLMYGELVAWQVTPDRFRETDSQTDRCSPCRSLAANRSASERAESSWRKSHAER